VTTVAADTHRAQVIDLMEALKESLGKRTSPGGNGGRKPPVKVAKRAAAAAKAQGRSQAGRR
jgi:hypothetical protein